jgi:hypothetical protein
MSVSFKFSTVRARLAAAVALAALLSPAVRSQQSTNPATDPNNAPVQIITKSQYDQMVANGQLKANNPAEVLKQFIARLLQDLKNGAIVENFIRQNPNVLGLAQLVSAAPRNPGTHITLDGNYRTVITAHGISQTIETFGPSTKLGQLAKSIVTSHDPANQLGLYNLAFSQYNNIYAQFCGSQLGSAPINTDIPPGQISTVGPQSPCQTLVAPSSLVSPASLQGAPIAQINSALRTIAANGTNLLHFVPTGVGPGPVACNEELGTSFTPGVNGSAFGDMVNSSGFSPSANGLVANFNFPAKNMLTCIRNQGQRGTCHIFAAISAIEEIIARDTGVYANLSEQDFMENEKLVWSPEFFNDAGSSGRDLEDAENNGYRFAFEKTWDYNPSLSQPRPPAYEFIGSCLQYPLANEPGCSATAPQANGFCVPGPFFICGLSPFQNPNPSPYSSAGVSYIWNPSNPDLSVDYIFLSLAFNSAVVLGFNETQAFQNAANGNGFIQYTPGNPLFQFILDPTLGGHYVHIVGYVSNEDIAANSNTASTTPASGAGYFIVKNSWGANVGDAGYLYMPVDYLKANAFELAVISSVNKN